VPGSPGVRVRNNKVDFVEVIGHYSNTPSLLADLRRTLDAVTTMII